MTKALKINKSLLLLPILLFSLLLVSCVSSPTAGTRVISYSSSQIEHDSWLVKRQVRIEDIKTDRKNGLLMVQIRAKFMARRGAKLLKPVGDKQFEYRFRWLDERGFQVKTGLSTWNTIMAVEKDVIHMNGVAPSENVVDFEFMIRFPDRQ